LSFEEELVEKIESAETVEEVLILLK
jgi:hypothetical protein